jgi:hypothetical protein
MEIVMTEDLQFLIDQARGYRMSSRERDEQIRSFAYGNTKLENDSITMGDIDDAMHEMAQSAAETDSASALHL